MGFFRIPNIMSSQGRPMPKRDLMMIFISAMTTFIIAFGGFRYVTPKTNYFKVLIFLSALSCVASTMRVVEDSRRRCKL
jgi:hypothetical protein